jgi:copper chaperone NosL
VRERRLVRLVSLRIALAVACGAVLLAPGCRGGEGLEPIAWDRTPCAHCHMLISDPAFAAQISTADGEVLDFDDPGCLLLHLEDHHLRPRAIWFHDVREDRWLRGNRVAFVTAGPTPMGYGLGAVEAGTPGSISLAEATTRAREIEEARTGVGPGGGSAPR